MVHTCCMKDLDLGVGAEMGAAFGEPLLGVAQSVKGSRWIPRSPQTESDGLAIAAAHQLPDIISQLLAARGTPLEEAAAYLEPTLRDLMPDPMSLKDMGAAAERLASAAASGEKIAVFGDYDVDGACSAALIIDWWRQVAPESPTPTLYIPDRLAEGYGLSTRAMTVLAADHTLIVAVDCGTISFEPIAAARSQGAEVLVVDHHLAQETVPDCVAVVNPNRLDDTSGQGHLCAAGVVFLLLVAAQKCLPDVSPKSQLMASLDLVALATVADIAPLIGVNRAFVRQGLKIMAQRRRLGLRELADVARLTAAPTAHHLGYLLGPRINAGGRVGQADLGARLLLCRDPNEAPRMAAQLDEYNMQRRAIEAAVFDAAVAAIDSRQGGPEAPLAWAVGEGWHPGVVGIVASRLKEKYNRPSLVIGVDEEGIGKGSGRSIEGVDLGGSVTSLVAEGLLTKGGGHKMAAGITVNAAAIPAAIERLSDLLAVQGAAAIGPRDLRIDINIAPSGATLDLIAEVERVGPFGAANPAPVFALPRVKIAWAKRVGETHLRFTVVDSAGVKLDAIAFGAFEGPLGDFLSNRSGQATHLAGRIEIDDWGGRRRPKLRVDDAAPADPNNARMIQGSGNRLSGNNRASTQNTRVKTAVS